MSITEVLHSLRAWARSVSDLNAVDGVYVFGSLIYEGGRLFDAASDVDLVIRLAATTEYAESRVGTCAALLPPLERLELDLATVMGETSGRGPVVSAVVATDFEIRTGIHKDKKWTLFHDSSFLRLDTDDAVPGPLGPEPIPAAIMKQHRLLSALTGAQEYRSYFLRFSRTAGRIAQPFDDARLALPKPLCRAAAQVRYVVESGEAETDVDVGVGLMYITDLLRAAPGDSARHRLLGDLTPRLGTKGARRPISPEAHLLLWETLFDTAREAFEKARAEDAWIHPETSARASAAVVRDLLQSGNLSLLAIDNGIVLYLSPSSRPLPATVPIIIPSDVSQYRTGTLKDPNEDELKTTMRGMDPDIQAYLSGRASGGARGKFQCKVGLRRIDLPVERVDQPLRLSVMPLSYWVVQEFNRRLLMPHDDRRLSIIRKQTVSTILRPGEFVEIPSPSALYVELALLTTDATFVVLEKNPQLSALARTGRGRWTCTLEEGLVWDRDVKGRTLDFASAISAGLAGELEVLPSEVADVTLLALALEHTHLNTAVLGFAQLALSSDELRPRIGRSRDFGRRCEFVPIADVQKRYFGDPQSGSVLEWHPTARLRLFLALRTLGAWKEAS